MYDESERPPYTICGNAFSKLVNLTDLYIKIKRAASALGFPFSPEIFNPVSQFRVNEPSAGHAVSHTPAILRLYSASASSNRSLAVVSPGTLWEGCM